MRVDLDRLLRTIEGSVRSLSRDLRTGNTPLTPLYRSDDVREPPDAAQRKPQFGFSQGCALFLKRRDGGLLFTNTAVDSPEDAVPA